MKNTSYKNGSKGQMKEDRKVLSMARKIEKHEKKEIKFGDKNKGKKK